MDTMIMKMPAVALRGMVILPGMVAHFDVSRAKSIKAVEEAMMDEQKIFLVAQKDVEQENPDIEDLFKIGIIAEVKQVIKLQNNIVRILVEGKERAELSAFLENPDYLLAEIIRFDEEVDDGLPEEAKEAMLRSIQETFGKYVVVNPKMGKELQRQLSEITDLEKLMNQLANSLPVHFEEKQKILDAVSMTERYEVLPCVRSRFLSRRFCATTVQRMTRPRCLPPNAVRTRASVYRPPAGCTSARSADSLR